tara:strand:+ start:2342 stop:3031 length:690 start_codon:yes stop_codon:yes gene_type:complete
MLVNLISYSRREGAPASDGVPIQKEIESLVAYCARVSNPANQWNSKTNTKLLKYLAKHKHWSPFEMVSMCLEIETTRDIARQILRHRSFSFQEFSQRYADPADLGDLFEYREARLQDTSNRQNSIQNEDTDLEHIWRGMQTKVMESAKNSYSWAIANGIAKEQARAVFPEGLTKSRLYMNGTLRSWLHYIELRQENGTQLEHILVAQECAKVIGEIFDIGNAIRSNDSI